MGLLTMKAPSLVMPQMKAPALSFPGVDDDWSILKDCSGYYEFNDLADSQALLDSSPFAYHGINGGAAGNTTNDVVFDGTKAVFDYSVHTAGDFITLPTKPDPLYAFAIVFYIAGEINAASASMTLFHRGSGSGLFLGVKTASLANEIISIFDDRSTCYTRAGWCSAAGSIAAGWHMLQINIEGSNISMELDGAYLPITYAAAPATAVPLPAGSGKFGGSSGGYLTGAISAFTEYSKPRSARHRQKDRAFLIAANAAKGIVLP
jgi:hypothetical protein